MTELKRSPVDEIGQLLSSSSCPMWIFDQETLAFLDVNLAAEEKYGYSREEFFRMTILDIRPTEDIPKLIRSALHPRQKGPATCAHWRHRSKAGQIFEVEVSSREIVFQGRPAEIVFVRNWPSDTEIPNSF